MSPQPVPYPLDMARGFQPFPSPKGRGARRSHGLAAEAVVSFVSRSWFAVRSARAKVMFVYFVCFVVDLFLFGHASNSLLISPRLRASASAAAVCSGG